MLSRFQRISIQLGAVLWSTLLLLGLLGLAVVGVWPWWMIGLVITAGLILGSLSYLLRRHLDAGAPTFRQAGHS